MNSLTGIIHEIKSEGHLSLVKIKINEDVFSSIVIDTPETALFLSLGASINILFKENEVVLAKSFSGQISLQNKFESTIDSIEMGVLLCKVVMNYKGNKIVSLITANAATQMNLVVGEAITAMVKTNEISLSPHD